MTGMIKLRQAVWCYVAARLHSSRKRAAALRGITLWILLISGGSKRRGMLTIGSSGRIQLADWGLIDLMDAKLEFDDVLSILLGDEFCEKNKRDVASLERQVGRSILTLWDTDPIFVQFPHLKGLARNAHFEKVVWPQVKNSFVKQK
jgi:hypothetical protein